MNYINLATEDELSEAVGLRLIEEFSPSFEVSLMLRKGGYGYLRSKVDSWCQMARRQTMLLITDLDNANCAPALIADWLGQRTHPRKLLFRVAVREIESWLLADHQAIKALFGKNIGRIPDDPDTLADPKSVLLKLAKKAPREIRKDLLPEKGANASQGLGYNSRLCDFVRNTWKPDRAAIRSDSLRRTRASLRRLK